MGLPEIDTIITKKFMNLRFSDDFELFVFFFFMGRGNQAVGLVTVFAMFHMRLQHSKFWYPPPDKRLFPPVIPLVSSRPSDFSKNFPPDLLLLRVF